MDEKELDAYFKKNISINIRTKYDCEGNSLNVELLFKGEIVSESYVCLNEDNKLM